MIIKLKNKHTLEVDEFQFRCSIGKKWNFSKKNRGDLTTPKGFFKLKKIFTEKIGFSLTNQSGEKITQMMGWCNDINIKHYNKLINIKKKLNMKDFIEKIINTTI